MSNLIWVIPSISLKNVEEFSAEWLISQKDIHVPLGDINGSSVWLVKAEQDKFFLFGHIQAIKVTKNSNDVHNDLCILYANRCASFRILPKGGNIADWGISNLNKKIGVNLATNQNVQEFSDVIKKNKNIRISKKFPEMSRRISKTESSDGFARKIYGEVLANNSLGDLAYSKNGKSPFGEIALHMAPQVGSLSENLQQQILRLDGVVLGVLEGRKDPRKTDSVPFRKFHEIYVDLVEVNPSTIFSRLFVQSSSDACINRELLQKIEDAECRHQSILKYAVNAILSLGLSPMKSYSVDLAVQTEKKLFIFEIKSTTPENYERQAKKSFIQILEYKMAFETSGHKNIFPIAVIENVDGNASIKKYLENFADFLGINLMWFCKKTIFREMERILK